MAQLKLAKVEGMKIVELKCIERADLIILDDFGLKHFAHTCNVWNFDNLFGSYYYQSSKYNKKI